MSPEVVGVLASLWILGILFFLRAGARHPNHRPPGWPWSVPLWPLMLACDIYQHYADKRRLARLKRDVWQR